MSEKRPVWSWTDAVAGAKVPPLTKLVCLNIARYLSSAGTGWRITIEEMVRDTGLSDRAVRTHLAKATRAELIKTKREYNHLGHRTATQYIPQFPDGVELTKEPATLPAPDAGRQQSPPARGAARLPAPRAGQVSSLVSLSKKEASPKATFVAGTPEGDGLIPFSSIDGASIIEAAQAEAAKNVLGIDKDRLPFTKDVLREIARMCVDLERLTKKYLEKTAGKRIANPSGYLLKMAREEVAQRDGVPVDLVVKFATSDRQQKAKLMAEAVGAKPEPKQWKAARWREKLKAAS